MSGLTASGARSPDPPRITWEDVPCPLCRARAEEPCLSARSDIRQPGGPIYRVVRCRLCGLGYLNPRPDVASIAQFYPDEYSHYSPTLPRRSGHRRKMLDRLHRLVLRTYFNYPPPVRSWYERAVAALTAPWLAPSRHSHTSIPFTGRGRLLDFGCGGGWMAARMKRCGWYVEGMDFSAFAACKVEQQFGIRVHVGTLPHPAIGPCSFDVINMGQVLEHVHSPHALIEAAAKALCPSGLLVVSVPNFEGWSRHTFGATFEGIDVPRHLLHFGPATLRRLLQAHGLEVEQLRILGSSSWMRATLARARRMGTLSWKQRWIARLGRSRLLTSALTHWTEWTRQADKLMAFARRPVNALVRAAG